MALILWIVVRGYDLGKWVGKKARKKEVETALETEETDKGLMEVIEGDNQKVEPSPAGRSDQ